jgi:hypothetical protein
LARTSVAVCALALGGVLVPVSSVAAQALITPPNRSDLIPPELRRDEQAPTLTIDGDFERPPCALDRPEFAGIRFTVAGAQFNGLDRVPGLSLEDAVAGYKGREVPVSVLCDIRAEANAILRRQGYLATVEIPEQTLADGTPDFNVIFGRLTSVRVRGDAGPSEKVVAGYLEKLTAQDVFNSADEMGSDCRAEAPLGDRAVAVEQRCNHAGIRQAAGQDPQAVAVKLGKAARGEGLQLIAHLGNQAGRKLRRAAAQERLDHTAAQPVLRGARDAVAG